MTVDFAAEGLLDGLEGDARAARERLLQRLLDQGTPLEELKRAVAEDRLVLLPAERLIGGEARYTGGEIAQRTRPEPQVLYKLRPAPRPPGPQPRPAALTQAPPR